ncbi:hypothetical protein HaLaN_28366 [Haematococcus lacustris]|uniref:Uncharacterized protein n=1 Tax=Haematococcus lacustris TaxID=44745 RepID=A0A6A0AA76_HAELA|nr:hypothetical protein HaLaN_28366 [Haematococcus lacustris]
MQCPRGAPPVQLPGPGAGCQCYPRPVARFVRGRCRGGTTLVGYGPGGYAAVVRRRGVVAKLPAEPARPAARVVFLTRPRSGAKTVGAIGVEWADALTLYIDDRDNRDNHTAPELVVAHNWRPTRPRPHMPPLVAGCHALRCASSATRVTPSRYLVN